MPGGCEALVHWRSAVEEIALSGAIEPLVAFDLDLTNMFGSIEWPEIRAAVDRDFQEASAWLRWQPRAWTRWSSQAVALPTRTEAPGKATSLALPRRP